MGTVSALRRTPSPRADTGVRVAEATVERESALERELRRDTPELIRLRR